MSGHVLQHNTLIKILYRRMYRINSELFVAKKD